MHNATDHHALTNTQGDAPTSSPSFVFQQDAIWHGTFLRLFCVRGPGCVPSQILVSQQHRQHEKLKSSWINISAVQLHLKHRCVVNTIFLLNLKHGIIPTTIKKTNSISAKIYHVMYTVYTANDQILSGINWPGSIFSL